MDTMEKRAHSARSMDGIAWEHFEHEADMGLLATAPTREGMFEGIGQALTAVITDVGRVRPLQRVAISCEAPDDAILLVDWLNALVYEMSTRRMLFCRFHVTLDGQRLTAIAEGEPVDRERHQPAVEVKGATYTELSVEQDAGGRWRGRCVVDV